MVPYLFQSFKTTLIWLALSKRLVLDEQIELLPASLKDDSNMKRGNIKVTDNGTPTNRLTSNYTSQRKKFYFLIYTNTMHTFISRAYQRL